MKKGRVSNSNFRQKLSAKNYITCSAFNQKPRALIVTLVVNVLANALPLNGLNPGEISDQFPILFVPAG